MDLFVTISPKIKKHALPKATLVSPQVAICRGMAHKNLFKRQAYFAQEYNVNATSHLQTDTVANLNF